VESARELLLTAGFCLFLIPFSVEGNSANYAFVLIPLGALLTGQVRAPSRDLLACACVYAAIFLLAAVYQHELIDELVRRSVSFLLFMSVFTYMFVEIDDAMLRAFKRALGLVAVAHAFTALVSFVVLGGSELGYEAKDVVGGQRFGFIYIVAFWVLVLARPRLLLALWLKYLATGLVLIGLMLSFSRASVVALLASAGLYAVWSVYRGARVSIGRGLRNLFVAAMATAISLTLLDAFFPVIIDFFEVRLVAFLADSDSLQGNLADADTSEGTRIFIWRHILDYVIDNPLTGSGFLGVWILRLFDDMSGSAHNQYLDVLFRVGFVGFFLYFILLYRTARLLAYRHRGLFWGFVGVLVYGLFHETFKESHGAFVLAFLFGLLAQRRAANRSDSMASHA
jgi:O-antigen ligase